MSINALPVILIAGIPGSGKTTIANQLANATILSADDFYLAHDDPGLPMKRGLPDWEMIDALDMGRLHTAVTSVARGEITPVPIYDMRLSRPTGEKLVDPAHSCVLVVEGVHCFELALPPSLITLRILIVAPIWKVAFRRLKRDIKEHRYQWFLALFYVIPLLVHYCNYNRRTSKKADHVVRYEGDSAVVAKRIEALAVSCKPM